MSTFYRKYRPQTFADVIGQEMVVRTLQNALEANIPAHGYLFTGSRGTGKTSLARIFAKVLNCQNRKGATACGKCVHCQAVANNQSLDILEIDAASYTGVDNIRSLRDTMNNAPLVGKYKVYIIDEVHMLSIGAFNALLKMLEEPPAHVIFLLATTELHKVPKTILSRVQRFDLRKLTLSEIVGKLKTISKSEGIKVEPAALTLIAKNSGGALRDAETLLTQMATLANGTLTAELVETTLGLSDSNSLYEILTAYTKGDVEQVLLGLKNLEDSGKNPSPITRDFLAILRNVLLYKARNTFDIDPLSLLTDNEQAATATLAKNLDYQTITLLLESLENALVKIKGSTFGFLPLEIAFVQNLPRGSERNDNEEEPPTKDSSSLTKDKEPPKSQERPAPQKSALKETTKEDPKEDSRSSSLSLETVEKEWRAIIEKVKLLNASLSVALASARPVAVKDNTLHIAVKYKFHQERLNEAPHRLTLQEAFDTILGTQLALSIVPETLTTPPEPREDKDPLIQHALELLGGKVV